MNKKNDCSNIVQHTCTHLLCNLHTSYTHTTHTNTHTRTPPTMDNTEADSIFTGIIGGGNNVGTIGDMNSAGLWEKYMMNSSSPFNSSDFTEFKFNELTKTFGRESEDSYKRRETEMLKHQALNAIQKIESHRHESLKLQPDDVRLQSDNMTMAQRLRLKHQTMQQATMAKATANHSRRRRRRRGRRGGRNRNSRPVTTGRTFGMYLHAAQRHV